MRGGGAAYLAEPSQSLARMGEERMKEDCG